MLTKIYPNQPPLHLLLKENYVKKILTLHRRLINPLAKKITKIKVYPAKQFFSANFSHVVIFYNLEILVENNEIKKYQVFCSGDTKGVRKKTFEILRFLEKNGLNSSRYGVPQTLFYSPHLKTLFYLPVVGENLRKDIIKHQILTEKIKQTAILIKKTHHLLKKSQIKTSQFKISSEFIDPTHILEQKCPLYSKLCEKIEKTIKKLEKIWLKINKTCSFQLVHGDFHPENILISPDNKKIYIIDFSESCFGPPEYDLGSFLQQLGYMAREESYPNSKINELQKIFLRSYFGKIPPPKKIKKINFFQACIAMRSAIFFLHRDKTHRVKWLTHQANQFLDKYTK